MKDSDRGEPKPPEDTQGVAGIDIEKLADTVYRLMLDELRMERGRGVQTPDRGRI